MKWSMALLIQVLAQQFSEEIADTIYIVIFE